MFLLCYMYFLIFEAYSLTLFYDIKINRCVYYICVLVVFYRCNIVHHTFHDSPIFLALFLVIYGNVLFQIYFLGTRRVWFFVSSVFPFFYFLHTTEVKEHTHLITQGYKHLSFNIYVFSLLYAPKWKSIFKATDNCWITKYQQ